MLDVLEKSLFRILLHICSSVVTWYSSSIDCTVLIADGSFILESGKSGYCAYITLVMAFGSTDLVAACDLCIAGRMYINHAVCYSNSLTTLN